ARLARPPSKAAPCRRPLGGDDPGPPSHPLPPPRHVRRRPHPRTGGPLPLPLDPVRLRPPSLGRRTALPHLREAGGARRYSRRRGGRDLRRVGAQRSASECGGWLGRLGRPPAPHAPTPRPPPLGARPAR